MNKKEMRAIIRAQKKAMTEAQIVSASARLGEQFRACELYKNAKTIYGYMPYNQEVRTVPMLEQAIRDGKRVAVPKCYGWNRILISVILWGALLTLYLFLLTVSHVNVWRILPMGLLGQAAILLWFKMFRPVKEDNNE